MRHAMNQAVRSGFLAVMVLCALGFGGAETAQARGRFSVSMGLPLGLYGGFYSQGYYGCSHYGRNRFSFSWYATPSFSWPSPS